MTINFDCFLFPTRRAALVGFYWNNFFAVTGFCHFNLSFFPQISFEANNIKKLRYERNFIED